MAWWTVLPSYVLPVLLIQCNAADGKHILYSTGVLVYLIFTICVSRKQTVGTSRQERKRWIKGSCFFPTKKHSVHKVICILTAECMAFCYEKCCVGRTSTVESFFLLRSSVCVCVCVFMCVCVRDWGESESAFAVLVCRYVLVCVGVRALSMKLTCVLLKGSVGGLQPSAFV